MTLIALGACAALPATAHGAEAWLTPEPLSQAGTFNDHARLATNSLPGDAAVIWSEFANGRTPRSRIRVSTREPDERWEPSERLSGASEAGAGAVGVDPQGRITAVWDEGDKVMWADKAPGHPWTGAQAIPDGAGVRPDLFVASNGTATAVWQKGNIDTLVIRTARRPLGGPWSAVETISPPWSYRAHIEGDIAGDVTVSFTHDTGAGSHYIYAVDRPNSGPWGAQTPLAGPAITDNVSDLVVAPNSGSANVFWQDGSLSDPLGARTRAAASGTAWSATAHISGGTAGRLDLEELDRAAVDGTGLVTAAWIAGRKVLTAYRSESAGWTAPTPPAVIDPGDGTTQLSSLQIASNAFGRALGTWTASGHANRWSLRGPGPGAAWSAPKAIDGVPADAAGLDLAVDGTGRVIYAWLAADENVANVASLAISTYGDPLNNPQGPAPQGPAPSAGGSGGGGSGGAGPGSSGSAAARARLQGQPTSNRGVSFVVTMPAAGTARILLARAGRATAAAAKYRRVGIVRVKLKKGRNVVRVRRVKKRKLARGKYRATITPKVGRRTLKPIKLSFRIRR